MTTNKQFSAPIPFFRQTMPGILVCLLGLALLAPASQAAERTLQSLNFSKLPGNKVVFTLTLSGKAPKPMVFTVGNPASLSIDIPDTQNGVKKRLRQIDTGNVRSAMVAQGKHRTRVVINLRTLGDYDVQTEGNKIRIDVASASSPAMQPASASGVSGQASVTRNRRIKDVNFHRGEHGAGQVIVQLSKKNTPVNVQRKGRKVVATFSDTHLPEKLRERLQVTDFATPAKMVTIQQSGPNTVMEVTPREGVDYHQVAYQTGHRFTLELQPEKQREKGTETAGKPKYTGERISLNFQKVGLRSVLQIIAEVAGKNIVVSPQVQGTMSLRLHNVPWDQALQIILSSNALGMREHGGVIMIAPLKTLAAKDAAQAKIEAQHEKLTPLQSAIIQVNYAKAGDIADLIKSKGTSLLSDRGAISVDKRTNSLLVRDTRERLGEIRHLIDVLDKPVRQVSISTRIVVAKDTFTKAIGTKFGVTSFGTSDNGQKAISTTGTAAGNNSIINSLSTGGGSTVATLPSLAKRFNVNAPVAGPTGQIALAILNSNFMVDLELQAKQAEGDMEVVSTPRVVTADGSEATISRGLEIPYQEATSSGATSISFKKAILRLKVTPQITPDGRIIMNLAVRDDSKSETSVLGEPAINTRRVNTRVIVNNGDTVVLGGIYEEETNHSISKVPLLGDIPLIGFLFRSKSKEHNKKQILVFVTPKVLNQKVNVNGI